jgi:hypothetical protein
MTFVQFLSWLSHIDLARADLDDLLARVSDVLEHLPEEDPRFAWMAAIEDKLLDGEIPVDRLRALAERFPCQPNLEDRLRSLVFGRRVDGPALQELRQAIRQVATQPQVLRELVHDLQGQLREFWDDYQSEPSHQDSEEAVATGHRLLEEAFQHWSQGLKLIGEGEFEPGLERAQHAYRLLQAVQTLDQTTS